MTKHNPFELAIGEALATQPMKPAKKSAPTGKFASRSKNRRAREERFKGT